MAKNAAYDAVYNQIIDKMSKGDIPWRKAWTGANPRNGKTGHKYSGINMFILSMSGYADQRWYTYKQATELGGQVKKGEKSTSVIFWTMFNTEDDNGKSKTVPVLRYFNVFNHEQIEGLKSDDTPQESIVDAEKLIEGYMGKPATLYGSSFAAYSPSQDRVTMPSREQFNTIDEFYGTLFHEYAHSTGHKDRLNRKTLTESTKFGSDVYSEEELVAELTSAFLCNHAGIDNTIDNSAAYIKGWMKAFKDNPKMIVQAASKAQKAADYILGVSAE